MNDHASHPTTTSEPVAALECDACDELLIDFAHGELAARERVAVTLHLAGCSRCALEFCRLRADLDGVLEAIVEAPPQAVRRRIREEVARSFGPRWWERLSALWLRPVPAYGVVLASLIPLVLWAAAALRPEVGEGARADVEPERPPALSDYDSMVPLLPEDRPI